MLILRSYRMQSLCVDLGIGLYMNYLIIRPTCTLIKPVTCFTVPAAKRLVLHFRREIMLLLTQNQHNAQNWFYNCANPSSLELLILCRTAH